MQRYWTILVAVIFLLFCFVVRHQWLALKSMWNTVSEITNWVQEMHREGFKPYRIKELVLARVEARLPEHARTDEAREMVENLVDRELGRLREQKHINH